MAKPFPFINKHRIYPLETKVNCKCFFDPKSSKSCRVCLEMLVILKPLYVLLASAGLNISGNENETRQNCSWRCYLPSIVVVLMHLFLIYRALVLTFRVQSVGYTIKLALLLIFREILVLFIWYAVYFKRKRISTFLRKLNQVSEMLPLPNKRKLFLLIRTLFLLTYSLPVFLSLIMTSMMTIEEAENYEYIAAFGFVTKGFTYYVNFTLYCMYNFYIIPLPLLVSFLYIFTSAFIYEMLKFCGIRLKKYRHLPLKIYQIFDYSLRISSLIEKMEEAMSVCIFFVITLNLTICFTSFAYMLGYYAISPSASVGVAAWFICSAASFSSIVWMASNINNESRNLKRTFMKILFRFEDNETISPAICVRVSQLDTAVLTGWQMFEFSKSLILTAAGTILTYGLLILQTRPSQETSD